MPMHDFIEVFLRGVFYQRELGRGQPTRTFNQAVKRNAERFPEDLIFQLSAVENPR